MVHIIDTTLYPNIKTVKRVLASGGVINITDQSLFNEKTYTTKDMNIGEKIVVTNHPKRSYFITIEKRVDGVFRVY